MSFMPPIGRPVTTTHLFDEWAQAEMLEQRTVFLRGELDEVTAGNVSSQLMFLDGAGDDDITLRIDSAGGSLQAAATLIDVIDNLGVYVEALATRAEGPALAVLAVCSRRAVMPHATLRMIEPAVEFQGSAEQVARYLEHHRKLLASLYERLSEATRMTASHLADEFAGRRYLSVEDAIALGVVDEVQQPQAEVRKLRRPMGFRPPE